MRVEHWDNAIGQGVVAAQNMLGKEVSYDRLPYFFSDQYDLGMEYLGNIGPDGYDHMVLRGTPEKGTFTAFWLREGRVLAGMHANDWDAMDSIRQIVGGQRVVSGLDDESVSLAQIADTARLRPTALPRARSTSRHHQGLKEQEQHRWRV